MARMNLLRALPRFLRRALTQRAFRIRESDLEGVTVRVADTVSQHLAAAHLVHECYMARGLTGERSGGVWLTPHLALPDSIIFVAERQGALIGTLSLCLDSNFGLPMEKAYPQEVQAVRAGGRRVAEVGAACVSKEYRGAGVLFLLLKAVNMTALQLGIDDFVISVRESAAPLYEDLLCFERMGGITQYPGINPDVKATALRLRVREAPEALWHRFGHLPRDGRNPAHMYFGTDHPQIRLPNFGDFLPTYQRLRAQAGLKLATLRPDVLWAMSAEEFERFKVELRGPARGHDPRLSSPPPPPQEAQREGTGDDQPRHVPLRLRAGRPDLRHAS